MDAERPLQESALPLRLRRQLLVEALQLLHALLDVVRRKVSSSDLGGPTKNESKSKLRWKIKVEHDWFTLSSLLLLYHYKVIICYDFIHTHTHIYT